MDNLRRKLQGAMMFAGAMAMAAGISGCFMGGPNGPFAQPGETQVENVSVPAGAAKSAHVHLQMAAGELNISGNSSGDAKHLLDGTISYNVPDWKPELSYSVSGGSGTLMIEQPEKSHTSLGGVKYVWDLHLSNKIPLDIAVEMGAGKSDLNLSGMNVESFSMEAGAGDATVDLTGPWKKNFSASFEGGVGQVRLRLPREVGVHVTIDGGLGSISAPEFKRDGDAYVNDVYGKSPITLEVHVEGGVGQVNLELASAREPA